MFAHSDRANVSLLNDPAMPRFELVVDGQVRTIQVADDVVDPLFFPSLLHVVLGGECLVLVLGGLMGWYARFIAEDYGGILPRSFDTLTLAHLAELTLSQWIWQIFQLHDMDFNCVC